MKFLAILIAICVAWTLCSAFYAGTVRHALRDRIRYALFARRDALRRLAIDGKVQASSFSYMYLERLLCRLIDQCFWYNIGSLVEFCWMHPGEPDTADMKRFEEKAPDELKSIRNQAIDHIVFVMAVNSPIVALFLVCASKMREKLKRKAAIYVQEPPEVVGSPIGMIPSAA